jgi:hypothetical protein
MTDELTRRCGVCGEERPAAAIDVRRRHVLVDDGRELAVEVIGGSQGRLTVGRRVRLSYAAEVDYPTIKQAWDALEGWPLGGDDAFDYPTVAQAWDALEAWDGRGDAPVGWTRRLSLDRHREGGDR